MAYINKSSTLKMREEWTEIYASKPISQNNLLEQSWFFAIIKAQQQHKELPVIEYLPKQMYQKCSMRLTNVTDSPILCDKTENTSLFMSKNVVSKNTLKKHYLGLTLIQMVW